MARAIWASFCHTFSTYSKPDHWFCPEGKSSWCGYQEASDVGKEKDYKHSGNLSSAILDEVKPIYLRLTDQPLLERCVRGATQNANEALNRSIWHMCPKESFCGVETVETAVCLAVIISNCGHAKLASVIELVLRLRGWPLHVSSACQIGRLKDEAQSQESPRLWEEIQEEAQSSTEVVPGFCCWTRRRHLWSWRILGTSKHKFKSQFSLFCWSIRCLYLIHNFIVSDFRPIHVIIISFLQYRIRQVPNLRECHFWLHSTWNQLWILAVLFPHFYISIIKTDLWDLWSRTSIFFGLAPAHTQCLLLLAFCLMYFSAILPLQAKFM